MDDELTNSPSCIRAQKIKEKAAQEEADHKAARAHAAATEARPSRTQVTRLGEPVRRSGRLLARSQSPATLASSQATDASGGDSGGKRAAPTNNAQPAAKRQKATPKKAGPAQEGESTGASRAQRPQGRGEPSSRLFNTLRGDTQPIVAAARSDQPRPGVTGTGRPQARPRKPRKMKSAADPEEFRRRVGGLVFGEENASSNAGPSNLVPSNVVPDPRAVHVHTLAGPSNCGPDYNPSYNNPPPFWHGNQSEGSEPGPDPSTSRYANPGNPITTRPYTPAVHPTSEAPAPGLADPMYYPQWFQQSYQAAAPPGLQGYGANLYHPLDPAPEYPPVPSFPSNTASDPMPAQTNHASHVPGMPAPPSVPPSFNSQEAMYPAVQNTPWALVPWPQVPWGHGPPAAQNAQWTDEASQPATVNPQDLHQHQPFHNPLYYQYYAPPAQQQQYLQQQQPQPSNNESQQQPGDSYDDPSWSAAGDPFIFASLTNGADMTSAFANNPDLRAIVDPDIRPRVDDSKTSPPHRPSRTFKLLGATNANRDGNQASLTICDPLDPGLPSTPAFQTPHLPGGFLCERRNQDEQDKHVEGTVIDHDEDNLLTRTEKKEFHTLWTVTRTIRPTRYAHPEWVKRVTRRRVRVEKSKRCNLSPRTNSSALARPTFLPDDETEFDLPEDDAGDFDPTSVGGSFKPAPVEHSNLFATVPGPSSTSNASQVAANTASSSRRHLPSWRPKPAQQDARRADRRGRIAPRSVPLPAARPQPRVGMTGRQPTQQDVDEHIDQRRQRLYRARVQWEAANPFALLPRVFRGNTMPLNTIRGQRTAHLPIRPERNVAGFPQRTYQAGPLWTSRDYDPSGFSRAHCNKRERREKAGELQDEEYDMTEEEFLAFVPWREWKFC
ncbi:uncharacterized protein J7T54_002545 [Emericellopsis cladophorae]|uniref:Uncharacterized protein n=1 Tax=Emericellopsis cladophorae TaxID=2686198 RepID=A0A9Q0BEF8_9HYPO|nr:uncharacterized protein J7T54_002545 [Emericellopsis cladophorae]KAI6781189.1 hypothetical protein J7T54_002545 [Emericellopsis cladophorae]